MKESLFIVSESENFPLEFFTHLTRDQLTKWTLLTDTQHSQNTIDCFENIIKIDQSLLHQIQKSPILGDETAAHFVLSKLAPILSKKWDQVINLSLSTGFLELTRFLGNREIQGVTLDTDNQLSFSDTTVDLFFKLNRNKKQNPIFPWGAKWCGEDYDLNEKFKLTYISNSFSENKNQPLKSFTIFCNDKKINDQALAEHFTVFNSQDSGYDISGYCDVSFEENHPRSINTSSFSSLDEKVTPHFKNSLSRWFALLLIKNSLGQSNQGVLRHIIYNFNRDSQRAFLLETINELKLISKKIISLNRNNSSNTNQFIEEINSESPAINAAITIGMLGNSNSNKTGQVKSQLKILADELESLAKINSLDLNKGDLSLVL